MTHYDSLVLKALIYGGGSTSENYIHQILVGIVTYSDHELSISEKWHRLDYGLQQHLIDILENVCELSLGGLSERQIIDELIEYVARKSGKDSFFAHHVNAEISQMTDEQYELAIENSIAEKRRFLLDLEVGK